MQQLLFYTMSGNTPVISQELIEKFKKGSRPIENVSIEEFEMFKEKYLISIDKTETDYNAGLFQAINHTKHPMEFI